MKKTIILVLIVSACILNINAQTGPYVGLRGSINGTYVFWPNAYGVSALKNDKTEYYNFTTGYTYMLSGGYNITDNFGVNIEYGASTQNLKFDNKIITREINLKYTQIPIFLKFTSGKGTVKTHIMIGAQFGLINSATQNILPDTINRTITNAQKNYYSITDPDIQDRYKKWDIQGVLGLGVDIYVTKLIFINAGIRLGASLADINHKDWQNLENRKLKDPNAVSKGYIGSAIDYYGSRNIFGGLNVGVNYKFKQ